MFISSSRLHLLVDMCNFSAMPLSLPPRARLTYSSAGKRTHSCRLQMVLRLIFLRACGASSPCRVMCAPAQDSPYPLTTATTTLEGTSSNTGYTAPDDAYTSARTDSNSENQSLSLNDD
jgi:hypothetical protein